MTRVALGIDVRVRAFLGEVGNVLQLLEAGGQRDLQVLFLDASDEKLLHRFSESRRPHPLSAESGHEGALAVLDGVRIERERLAPLRASATRVIDTTNTSVHDLRRMLVAHFGPASGGAPRMVTRIVSFGFKYGTPVDADLVLDVRFLDNPYFVPELQAADGPRRAGRALRPRRARDAGVPAAHARASRVRDAQVRARGKELPHHRHRLHGRAAPVGRPSPRRSRASSSASPGAPIAVVHRDVHRGDVAPPTRARRAPRSSARRAHDERSSAARAQGRRRPRRRRPPRRRRRAHEEAAMSEAIGRFTIVNQLGLHARAATKLVQLASKFPCEVEVAREDQSANGKSVMGVLLLCGSKGTVIEVRARGEQAEECVRGHRRRSSPTSSERGDERAHPCPARPAHRARRRATRAPRAASSSRASPAAPASRSARRSSSATRRPRTRAGTSRARRSTPRCCACETRRGRRASATCAR